MSIKRNCPREIKIAKNVNPRIPGSVIVEFGQTKVYITAMVEEKVPPFLKGSGTGWVTAEYSMLPGSSNERITRERKGAKGRTHEIQRLIGRSLRAAIDLQKLGERSITVDCDVLVADGGTRTASISGGYVALVLAIKSLMEKDILKENPIIDQIMAISVGVTSNGEIIADLNYEEDSSCETDMNIVLNKAGDFIEIQGTAEGKPFSYDELNQLIKCAQDSLKVVKTIQNEAIDD